MPRTWIADDLLALRRLPLGLRGSPDRPWEGRYACGCGAAGMPCSVCNKDDAPRMSDGFKINTDKSGTRH